MFEALSKIGHTAIARLHVRSVLNPIMWVSLVVSPIWLGAAYWFRATPPIVWFSLAVAAAPVAVACLAYIGFAVFAPNRLQSEEYQLQNSVLSHKWQAQPGADEISEFLTDSSAGISNPQTTPLAIREGRST